MSEPTTQSEERTTLVYDDDGLGRPPWAMSSPMLKEYYDTEWGPVSYTHLTLPRKRIV